MMTKDQIEEKICANQEAFNIYGDLIRDIIKYQFHISDNEREENYEVCQHSYNKVSKLIAFSSVKISRLIDINSDELFELFMLNYNAVKEEIK